MRGGGDRRKTWNTISWKRKRWFKRLERSDSKEMREKWIEREARERGEAENGKLDREKDEREVERVKKK